MLFELNHLAARQRLLAFPFGRRSYQTTLCGVGGSFGSVGGFGLVQDAAHVVAPGLDTDEQLFADLPVGLAAGDEAQDLGFTLCEASG